ncbi:MAG: DNA alkylation repair protein [Clostridia bacterium]|nr:DNA alkylation repair protein [Clostridia bacterium]
MIKERLISLQDLEYKKFQASLMPTVAPESVIGVRTPLLKAFARELRNTDVTDFLSDLPHTYYEENNLHAFLLCDIKDFDLCLSLVEKFLPYVDNWATCDSMRPKCFKKNPQGLLPFINRCLASKHTYTVRYGIGLLTSYFLDGEFDPSYLKWVGELVSHEYYINMMQAWYFATALAKQWECTVGYITEYKLPLWVHNKTIQKAVESYRITDEQKAYLKAFRRKN